MINGERQIKPESLVRWCNGLHIEEYQGDDKFQKGINDLIKEAFAIFKEATADMFERDGIRVIQPLMSQAIYDRYLKYRNYGIRVANYFECFVICSDVKTQKKMIKGYGDDQLQVGHVHLFRGTDYENDDPIGSIGEKSDLIWSIYFNLFVVGFYEGYPQHTLFNHDEILSLQLWDTENMTPDELDDYVNQILVEVSVKLGLKFRIISPDELWKSPGEAGEFNLTVSNGKYSSIPLQYLEYGLNTSNDRISYLHLYQVLEYFFTQAQNQAFRDSIHKAGFTKIDGIDDKTLHMLLRKYTQTLSESIALRIVLKRSIDASWLRAYIRSSDELLQQYTVDHYAQSKIVLNPDSNDEKLIDRISDRIYFFRCAIAHAKGETPDYMVLPSIRNDDISKELPLLRAIAKQVIDTWS